MCKSQNAMERVHAWIGHTAPVAGKQGPPPRADVICVAPSLASMASESRRRPGIPTPPYNRTAKGGGLLGASLLASLLALAGAAAAPAAPTTLRVGMDPRTAPWAFVPGHDYSKEDFRNEPGLTGDQLSRLTGVDVEVMEALARLMGVRMEVVPTPWIELEARLLSGRFDLILNAWTPSSTTPPGIVATDPYYTWSLLIATRASDRSITSVSDLAGRRVGHVSDPSVLDALRAMGSSLDAQLEPVDQGGEELFARLGRSDLDAVIFDSTFVRWRIARDSSFHVVGEPLNRLGYHVGLRRGDDALFVKTQAAVRRFVGSPEAAELRRKWESHEAPAP
jgi:ABC-type amino acid transport substrate-binding protein